MPSSRPSEIRCTGQPRRPSITILSKKESTAAPNLGTVANRARPKQEGGWTVPAADDYPDRGPRAELRVRRFAEAVAQWVGERAVRRPAVHSVCCLVFPASACRCALCGLRLDSLHAGSLVSGPTGRQAWLCQKRRRAYVGLVTALGAKQNKLGLDQCSLRMQARDLRV